MLIKTLATKSDLVTINFISSIESMFNAPVLSI